MESIDRHWDFLKEIEAPMWVDLTLEAQYMEQDIDDAWFHVSHPIHQMSSHQLKSGLCVQDKLSSPKLSCKSPKLPESVSRSRGKHYKSLKWTVSEHGVSIDKQHPIRKLGGKSFGMASCPSASVSNSRSMLTMDSSMRKTICYPQSNSVGESRSTGSVASKYPNLRSKSSFGGPANSDSAKSESSKVSSNISNLTSTSNPRGCRALRNSVRGNFECEKHMKSRKSSSSKSSVGSSYSLGSKLKNINSVFVLKEERNMDSKIAMRSVSVSKTSEGKASDGTLSTRQQRRGSDVKSTSQGSKTKVLGSSVLRKPLSLRNESMPIKNRVVRKTALNVGARNLNSVSFENKENTAGVLNQKDIEHSEIMTRAKGLPKIKGKASGEKQARNLKKVVQKAYLR